MPTRLAKCIVVLRNAKHGQRIDSDIASEVVHHFNIRTKFIRDFFEYFPLALFREFINDKNSEYVLEILRNSFFEEIDSLLERPIEQTMSTFLGEAHFIIKAQKKNIMKNILLACPHIVDSFLQNTQLLLSGYGERFKDSLHNSIDKSHKNALKNYYETNLINSYLVKFTWKIYEHAEDLILPDCISITITKECVFPSLLNSNEDSVIVCLPIQRKKLLIGYKGCLHFDINTYNLHAARNSESWFVAHPDFRDKNDYHSLIKENISNTLSERMTNIFLNSISNK